MRRFSKGSFDEFYATTLGISVSKKCVAPTDVPSAGPRRVEMILFDVMGQRKFRDVLLESYFKGGQAILAVWDVTQPETLGELRGWIDLAREVAGPIPVVIAANKVDLAEGGALEPPELGALARDRGNEWFRTSAKTGENVEAAFARLAEHLIRRAVLHPTAQRTGSTTPSLESLARGLTEDSPRGC